MVVHLLMIMFKSNNHAMKVGMHKMEKTSTILFFVCSHSEYMTQIMR